MSTRAEALAAVERVERYAGPIDGFQAGELDWQKDLATIREALKTIPTDVPLLWQCSQCAEAYDDRGHECREQLPVEELPIYIAPWERAILGSLVHPDAITEETPHDHA